MKLTSQALQWTAFSVRIELYQSYIVHVYLANCCLKAKFHYAIWSQIGPKLVADLQRAGIRPII